GQTGARVDADDAAVQLVHVVEQVGDGVDVLHVRGDRQGQDGVVVPGAQVLQLVPVVRPVLLVRVGKPRVQEEIHVAVGGALVHRCDVHVGDLDVVALLLQDHLPHLGDRDRLLPGDQRDVDVLNVVTGARTVVLTLVGASG